MMSKILYLCKKILAMANNILIVPDVHGRNFWLPALDYPGEVVFLGDYTDPYPQEGFTDENAYQGLLKIVEFKQANPERVTLLIGNHEMHYYNDNFSAGRFSSKYYDVYHEILTGESTKDLFQICKHIGNYLFIHAGVTKHWYERHYSKFENLGDTVEERLNRIFFEKMRVFHEAGEYRGGWDMTGSPLWADLREFDDETERFMPGIIQIIGHTQRMEPEPLLKDDIWMLDNKQLYLLRDNTIEKYT